MPATVAEEVRLHAGMEWRHMTPAEAALFRREPPPGVTIVLNRLPGEDGWARAGLTREEYAAIFGTAT